MAALKVWPLTVVVLFVLLASALSLSRTACVSPDPALEAEHDLERSMLSSRAATERDAAILACGNDPICIASTATAYTRFEAEALRALALTQREAVVSLCEMRADER